MPSVVKEALAYGLPVVTTDKCGARIAMMQNEINGEIIEGEIVNTLVMAIKTLSFL